MLNDYEAVFDKALFGPRLFLVVPIYADEFTPDSHGHRDIAAAFLKQYCLHCHGPDESKGEFRVDKDLPIRFQEPATSEKWIEVLEVLNAGEMPPEGEPRPDAKHVTAISEWIEKELDRAAEARTGSRVVLRRLNRAEYDNTMRDLIGLPLDVPLSERFGFPEDPRTEGFDNVGGTLMMSMMQMELYLEAAEYVINRAIVQGPKPPSVKWRVRLLDHEPNRFIPMQPWVEGTRKGVFVRPGNYDPMNVNRKSIKKNEWIELRTYGEKAGYNLIQNPLSGPFVLRTRLAAHVPGRKEVARRLVENYEPHAAGAQQRLPNYYTDEKIAQEKKSLRTSATEDFRYDYRAARAALELSERGQPRTVAEFGVRAAMDEGEIHEFNFWLDPGAAGVKIQNAYFKAPGGTATHGTNFKDCESLAPMPYVFVDWLEFEGPVFKHWPPAWHTNILFDSPLRDSDPVAYAHEVLTKFMRRAYRRQVTAAEVDAKMKIFLREHDDDGSFEDAIKESLIAILTSPHFLFIVEPKPEADQKERDLNNFEIASRLSYFLWSSMPDERLLSLAESGDIRTLAIRIAEVQRMLNDPRSEAFVSNFAGQWLKLRDIGKNPPGELLFPHYDAHLESSMEAESKAFFGEILEKDLNVRNFIDSDWIMINERLAKFYGIDGVKGDEIRRVELPEESPRGGVLTQASVLCVTSNGTRTSPVVRGVWILENILNDPPPPPPPNVEEVEQPAPGKSTNTQRERLAIHREVESCARCHRKIDPLGFALEHFDGSGYWRTIEASGRHGSIHRNDPKVDASAKLPDGTEFYGSDGLKKELLKREDEFMKALATKMHIYALGRDLVRTDRAMIADAVTHMKQNDRTLRSLIEYIAGTPAFLTK